MLLEFSTLSDVIEEICRDVTQKLKNKKNNGVSEKIQK